MKAIARWELPELSEDAAKALLKSDFGTELHKIAVQHMTFFTFGTIGPEGVANIRNGTCFFLKTPHATLAVTAKHVIEGYRDAKATDDRVQCQIGNCEFDVESRLIALGERVDIATLEVTERDLKSLGKAPITLWPPEPPAEGQGVLFAGYPAAEVRRDGPRSGSFGIYTAVGVVQSVTDWQLTSRIEREYSFNLPQLGKMPPQGYSIGGMSGGPMLARRERGGILSFPLAGVISEGYSTRDATIAERADFIRADGTITR